MTESPHVPNELLVDYAAGSMPEPVALAVATHIWFCDLCRDRVAALEGIGGVLIDDLAAEEGIDDDELDAVMIRLDEITPPDVTAPGPGDVAGPLRSYVGPSMATLKWRHLGGALDEHRIDHGVHGYRTSLLRIKPGRKMPSHVHSGQEISVILSGSYSDNRGQYTAGDFVLEDQTHEHSPIAGSDEPCICLAVLDAPLKFTGRLSRILNPFVNF